MKYTIVIALLLATVSSIQIHSIEEPAAKPDAAAKPAVVNNMAGSLEEDPALDAAYYRPNTSQGHIMNNRANFKPLGMPM